MKIFTTILVVIVIVVAGRWIIQLEGLFLNLFMSLYSMFFIGVFGYGVYKILESFEK